MLRQLAVQLLGSSLVASCLSRAFVYMREREREERGKREREREL